jgi:DNA-binding NarL/FixJ family response regulator
MFIDGCRRFLSDSGFQIVAQQLEPVLAPDLGYLEVPRASVYVIDAYAQRQATAALLGNIHEHNSGVGLLVVGDNLKEADSYTLLRQGIKGILNYAEAREQLPNALRRVASGCLATCYRAL